MQTHMLALVSFLLKGATQVEIRAGWGRVQKEPFEAKS